ncbi:hypothetical protein [Falsiroseomonas sp. E2-1-a4]|uniref:hypothetical protein n=1 Tax=Falsiroseomonas sp. E2-1-a4 TaxID=3239299 RepID=UPI003F399E46
MIKRWTSHELRRAIFATLYLHLIEDTRSIWSLSDLSNFLGSRASLYMLRMIIDDLNNSGFLRSYSGEDVEFLPKGLSAAEQTLVDHDGAIRTLEQLGVRISRQVDEDTAVDSEAAAGVSEAWEPLPLDRDSYDFKSAVENTENLIERVRGDNGFAVAKPQQHAGMLWSLQTGLQALRAACPSKAQLAALLLAPMRWLVENFTKNAVGELAKQAGQQVARLIGWTN